MTGPLMAVEKALVELSGRVRAEAETTARFAKAAAVKAAAKAASADTAVRDRLTAEAVSLAQTADEYAVPARQSRKASASRCSSPASLSAVPPA
jgi:osmotically-inducible protein OsmY